MQKRALSIERSTSSADAEEAFDLKNTLQTRDYGTVGPPSAPATGPQEPRFREPIRGLLAMGIVLIFAGEVAAGMSFSLSGNSPYAERIQALKDVSAIFLGPTIALAGAATGFYFGRSG
jgi:hypothetical protein